MLGDLPLQERPEVIVDEGTGGLEAGEAEAEFDPIGLFEDDTLFMDAIAPGLASLFVVYAYWAGLLSVCVYPYDCCSSTLPFPF